MKVNVKVFPIAGLCEQTRELEISLENGCMAELTPLLEGELGVNPGLRLCKNESLMFLHNGRRLDEPENTVLCDGDLLWLLPQISGG